MTKLGTSAIEEILCSGRALGTLAKLVPYDGKAWSAAYPDLSALPHFEGEPARLRICIATEDIVGPVRNGGIGTTYAALAELLGELGHDVTVLYLQGNQVENGTLEHWIDHYAARNVHFVPVPNYARMDRLRGGTDRWLHAPYNMLRYLIEHPMDVVHVSEWRGSGYLSLLAKHQGLAFSETLFVVKASSPWLWNRLYGSHPLDRVDDIARVHAERKSIELADMVVGGSLHLLRWMRSQGYRLPARRTFVQPNVVGFAHLADLVKRRQCTPGTRLPIDEIVFFGRLEARKGLLVFVQALKRLARQGSRLPRQVTFMGKPGDRLSARLDQDILDFIRIECASLPTKVQILTEFQQYEAVQYLLDGKRLAVMPSIIENSSLAVYEAVICGIPFIASTSGGTPELIASTDHAHVLCDPHPIPLADKLADALERGGHVAAPSFDNGANLERWRQFHLDLGRGLFSRLLSKRKPSSQDPVRISVCIYHGDREHQLAATLGSIKDQDQSAHEIIVAVDTDVQGDVEQARRMASDLGVAATVIAAFDLDAGQSFNLAAGRTNGDFLLFLPAGATLESTALRTLSRVSASADAELLSYFFRVVHEDDQDAKDHLNANVLGSIAQTFFHGEMSVALPLMVKRATFMQLGGFTGDHRMLGQDYELVARAQVRGVRCETAVINLGTVLAWNEKWLKERCYDLAASQFRIVRPKLAAAPLALRDVLLMAKGFHRSAWRRPKKDKPDGAATMPTMPRRTVAGKGSLHVIPKQRIADKASSAPAQTAGVDKDMQSMEQLANRPRLGDPRSPPSVRRQGTAQLHWLSTAPGKRYTGRLFGVHNGMAYGFVRNEDRPSEPVQIEIVQDDYVSRTVEANAVPCIVPPTPEELKGHGFSFPVWNRLFGLRWRRGPRHLVVRVHGSDVELGELVVMPRPDQLIDAGFDGYCDLVDATIRGWVWQPSHPENQVDISVFVDGKFLARATAGFLREDLRAAHIGSGAHGFAVWLPPMLRDGTTHSIDVVVTEAGVLLKRGRLRLNSGILSFAP